MNRSKVAGVYVLVFFSLLTLWSLGTLGWYYFSYDTNIIQVLSSFGRFSFISYLALIILSFFIIKEKMWAKVGALGLLGILFVISARSLILSLSYRVYGLISSLWGMLFSFFWVVVYLVGLILVIISLGDNKREKRK